MSLVLGVASSSKIVWIIASTQDWLLIPFKIIVNSSPPKRATAFVSRTQLLSRFAAFISNASPILCSNESFTSLNRSRSINNTANCVPRREAFFNIVIQSIVKNVADWQASQSNEISLVPDNLTDSFVCDVRKINEGIACYSISAMCRSNTKPCGIVICMVSMLYQCRAKLSIRRFRSSQIDWEDPKDGKRSWVILWSNSIRSIRDFV